MVEEGIKKYLNIEAIEAMIPDRDPRLFIQEAQVIENDVDYLIAYCLVTEEMCEGHFPSFPILPLAVAAEAAGQAGSLLVIHLLGVSDKIVLAVSAEKTRYRGGKKKGKGYIMPGDTMEIKVTYTGGRALYHTVNAGIYVEGILMVSIEEIGLIVIDKQNFGC